MVLVKMAAILFKIEHQWEIKQRATIGIPNTLDIPAPTVLLLGGFSVGHGFGNHLSLVSYLIRDI